MKRVTLSGGTLTRNGNSKRGKRRGIRRIRRTQWHSKFYFFNHRNILEEDSPCWNFFFFKKVKSTAHFECRETSDKCEHCYSFTWCCHQTKKHVTIGDRSKIFLAHILSLQSTICKNQWNYCDKIPLNSKTQKDWHILNNYQAENCWSTLNIPLMYNLILWNRFLTKKMIVTTLNIFRVISP